MQRDTEGLFLPPRLTPGPGTWCVLSCIVHVEWLVRLSFGTSWCELGRCQLIPCFIMVHCGSSVPSPCFLQASPAKLPLCRFNEGTTTFQARANRVRHRKQKHQKDLLLFVFSFCDSSSPFSTGRSVVLNMAFGSSAEHEQLSMEKMPLNFQSMSMSTYVNQLKLA